MSNESILEQFVVLTQGGDDIDLATAALLIAATEYPGMDIPQQLSVLDSLAGGASQRLGRQRDPLFSVNTLSEYLFDEVGFRGNEDDYYDPRNSYLNEVLRRRSGIPISLALVCVEVGKRLGIPLVGIGMPGHFLLRHRDLEDVFIDPFSRGILLSEEECAGRMRQITQANVAWDPGLLSPVSNRDFIARMLRNLKGIYLQREDFQRSLAMIERIVLLRPELLEERRDRGLVLYQLGRYEDAREDLQNYLDSGPQAADLQGVRRIVNQIRDELGG